MWGRGTPWRVSHKAKRESFILSDNSDLVDIMRWLGDTAELAFKPRAGSPAAFAIGMPAGLTPEGQKRPDTVAHFFNWNISLDDEGLVHIRGRPSNPVRDEQTGKKVRDSQGFVVYKEVWQRRYKIQVMLYNHFDAHFEGAREFVQARKDQRFVFYFKTFDEAVVTPSGPNYNQGASEDDAESVLPEEAMVMPDIHFEQQDWRSGAFFPVDSPKFETMPDVLDRWPPRQVITAQHRLRAFEAMLKQRVPPPIARIQVEHAFKDAYMFDEHDAHLGGAEEIELDSKDLYTQANPETSAAFDIRAFVEEFTGFSIIYRLPVPTLSRGPPSSTKPDPREGKREKTESPFRVGTKCSFCNRRKAVAACDGCGDAKYCGAQCQKIAWHFDGHHKTCRS